MLAQRLRRWTNIEPALVQRLVFAGMPQSGRDLIQRLIYRLCPVCQHASGSARLSKKHDVPLNTKHLYNIYHVGPNILCVLRYPAGPDSSFVSTGAFNLGERGSNPGRAGYLYRGCAAIYSAANCSNAWSVQCCLW